MTDIREKNLRIYSGFSQTPDGWDEVTVDEICALGRGRVISHDEINDNPGAYPVYSSQTRDRGTMGYLASYDFDRDMVTWTTDGENAGTVFYRSGKYSCTNVCGTLNEQDKGRLDLRFLTYHLGRIAKKYVSYIGNPKLMNGVMGNIAIALPPITQQLRIAEILSTVDEAIEQTEALIAKIQQIKAGLMHDLFTRGVTPDGQLRPPREEAPQHYKESPLGWIPKEWITDQLQTWLSYISYGFTNPMPETLEGPYMVTAADVTGGRIQYETCRRTSQEAYDRLLTQKSRPQLGDVLLTKDGTLGRLAIVDRESVCINQSVAVLRSADPLDSRFLAALLSSPNWQQKMLLDAGGSAIKHIYITVVDKMIIGWPGSPEERRAIVEILQACENKLESGKEELEKLTKLKYGLMQDLLCGRVRVAKEISSFAPEEAAANV